jgi:hypothetical protein
MNQVALNILIQFGISTILAGVVKLYFDRKLARQNVQYSRIFDEIAPAISETYAKLTFLHLALEDYTQPPTDSFQNGRSLEERRKAVINLYKDFEICFASRRLFFQRKTGELIDAFTRTVRNAILEFKRSVELGQEAPELQAKIHAKVFFEVVHEKIPEILEKLENDFRAQLGTYCFSS